MNSLTEIFGEPVYTYTRRQALEDGVQVDISETAREAGIVFPTFITRTAWATYVEVPPGVTCQDERGRCWDIVWMLRYALLKKPPGDRLLFSLYVRNDNTKPKLIQLRAICAARDIDDPAPSLTILMPDED